MAEVSGLTMCRWWRGVLSERRDARICARDRSRLTFRMLRGANSDRKGSPLGLLLTRGRAISLFIKDPLCPNPDAQSLPLLLLLLPIPPPSPSQAQDAIQRGQ